MLPVLTTRTLALCLTAKANARLERLGLFYVRYMDDILVLSPSRWRLRKAVKFVNQVLTFLKLEKHPEKTFVGKTERGSDFLDFLGYPIRPDGISVASKTLERTSHALPGFTSESPWPQLPRGSGPT